MPGVSSTESRSPCPIPPKRSFADFDESDPSSSQPSTTKRLRIETEEAKQKAKFVQTIQQRPKPLYHKRSHASFLEDLVDPLPSSPAPKKYRPESVNSSVIQWLESYRERHCRSDTLLNHSDGDLIPRRLTKSVPNMEYTRDANGFVMPPTPTSCYDPSIAPSDISGASTGLSRRSLVEEPSYRRTNLGANNIYMCYPCEKFPEHIVNLVDHVARDRNSPGPSLDQVRQDTDLYDLGMGSAEPAVENYLKVGCPQVAGKQGREPQTR